MTHFLSVKSWLLVPFQALEINGGFRWQRLITRHYQETVHSSLHSVTFHSLKHAFTYYIHQELCLNELEMNGKSFIEYKGKGTQSSLIKVM